MRHLLFCSSPHFLLIAGAVLGFSGCGGSEAPPASIAAPTANSTSNSSLNSGSPTDSPASFDPSSAGGAANPQDAIAAGSAKTVLVELDLEAGRVVVELYRDKAPDTVHNFLNYYVYRKHYDNSLIHYVSADMLIGGGYDAEQKPTPTYGPIVNESDNGLSNERGTIAMSRHPDFPDSATSQFFFNLKDNPGLNHQVAEDGVSVGGNGYCVFGRVTEGLDVLDQLAKKPTTSNDQFVNFPTQPAIVRTIRRVP